MKNYITTPKYITYNNRRARKSLSRRLQYKDWRKNLNRHLQGVSKIKRRQKTVQKKYDKIEKAPNYFSFIKHPKETIKFINRLEKNLINDKSTYIDLENVKYLDNTSVTALVSVMFLFKAKDIDFNGNFPEDEKLHEMLIDSDFFKYLNKPIGERIEYSIGKPNQIFTRANKNVYPELGETVMEEVGKTVWGEKKIIKGLQRVLLELMHNTNNHAAIHQKGVKHWWLSVNHDKINKSVSFVFVDYGVGIFQSLNNKNQNDKWRGWKEKVEHIINSDTNKKTFEQLLDGKLHLTVTGKHFRGKGLPGIKQVFMRNYISNLQIISNNVFANVSKSEYSTLSNSFSGTLFYWEINNKNKSMKWIN